MNSEIDDNKESESEEVSRDDILKLFPIDEKFRGKFDEIEQQISDELKRREKYKKIYDAIIIEQNKIPYNLRYIPKFRIFYYKCPICDKKLKTMEISHGYHNKYIRYCDCGYKYAYDDIVS